MKSKLALLAVAAGAALAACTDYRSAPPPGAALEPLPAGLALRAGQCFRSREIRGHKLVSPNTILINVDNRDFYRIDVSGGCLAGAISSDPLVMREPPGSSLVCRPIDLDVAVSKGGSIPSTCIVQSITQLQPQEVASLPPRLRP
jgi:hypothetical protein